MHLHKIFSFFFAVLLFTTPLFCQVPSDSFEFQYNNLTYHGAIEAPNQKAKGLIILIPGHGPTDFVAGEEYRALRSFFTQSGFAVGFWDKAGCGKSEGTYDHNQSIISSTEEAMAALSKLKSMDVPGSHKIGLWGISRAGWICPLILEQDPSIAFWISVSGTDAFENSRYMLEANLRAEGRSEPEIAILMKEWDHYQKVLVNGGESLEDFLGAIPNLLKDPYFNPNDFQFTQDIFEGIQNAYQNSGNTYDSASNLAIMVDDFETTLGRLTIPVLAIFGEKDSQVDWKSTLKLYRKTIGNEPKGSLTVKTFPNGNHTLQKCKTGGINEDLEEFGHAFCDGYFEAMGKWLDQLP